MNILDKLGEIGESKNLKSKQNLIGVGDRINEDPQLFFVENGLLVSKGVSSTNGNKMIHRLLTVGDLCNPEAVFSDPASEGVYMKNVSVLPRQTLVSIRSIQLSELRQLMMIDNEVSQLVLSYIGKNLLYAEQQLENMVFLNSRTRIIQAIVDLADIHGQRIGYETFINIPLTQDDIAELSLTSRQTVTTLFSELKRSNIIHVAGRGKILIRDLKSFRNLEF